MFEENFAIKYGQLKSPTENNSNFYLLVDSKILYLICELLYIKINQK